MQVCALDRIEFVHLNQLLLLSFLPARGFVRAMEYQTNNDQGWPPIERLQTALGLVLCLTFLVSGLSLFILCRYCWFAFSVGSVWRSLFHVAFPLPSLSISLSCKKWQLCAGHMEYTKCSAFAFLSRIYTRCSPFFVFSKFSFFSVV